MEDIVIDFADMVPGHTCIQSGIVRQGQSRHVVIRRTLCANIMLAAINHDSKFSGQLPPLIALLFNTIIA